MISIYDYIVIPYTSCTIKFVYVVVPSLVKLLFRDTLRMIRQIHFKFGSINFHKQRNQLVTYQYQGIVPLILSVIDYIKT